MNLFRLITSLFFIIFGGMLFLKPNKLSNIIIKAARRIRKNPPPFHDNPWWEFADNEFKFKNIIIPRICGLIVFALGLYSLIFIIREFFR